MANPSDQTLPLQIVDMGVLIERHWAADLSRHDLSPGEYRVLAVLSEKGPLTAVDVSPHITLEQSLISRTVQRLFEKGLVSRRRSRTDRRNVTLRATPAGRALAQEVRGSLNRMAEALTRNITEQQSERIAGALAVMAGNLATISEADQGGREV